MKISEGMERRRFLKTVGLAALAMGASVLPGTEKIVRTARAGQPGDFTRCKLIVFGSDSLRIDYARTLVQQDAPALTYLTQYHDIICSMANGKSATQPGWATLWSALPSYYHGAFSTFEYAAMPKKMHLMKKLTIGYRDKDLFLAWITGKGANICGRQETGRGPHWEVRRLIEEQGFPGVYWGDVDRDNHEVFGLAETALQEALTHENYCCFIHFPDPDITGHLTGNYDEYMQKALEVDGYIWTLLQPVLADDPDIIYCSDHGFNFAHMGDTQDGHRFSPRGVLSTNMSLGSGTGVVDMCSVGRLIYAAAGGDPDNTVHINENGRKVRHALYGSDLL